MEDGTCQKCQGLQCHWPLRMGLGHHEKGWKVEWRDRPGRLAVSLSGVYSKLGICLCLVRRKYWSCILLGSMVKICEDSKRFFRFKWQWFADGIRWPCWYPIFLGSFLKANGKLMFNLVVYLKFTVHPRMKRNLCLPKRLGLLVLNNRSAQHWQDHKRRMDPWRSSFYPSSHNHASGKGSLQYEFPFI